MTKFEIAKAALMYAAKAGGGTITYTVIKNNVSTDNLIQKIVVGIGAYALSSVVADAAKNQIERDINSVTKPFTDIKEDIKTAE